jgi:hypothetical protein
MLAKYLGTASIISEVTIASTTNNSIKVKPVIAIPFDVFFITSLPVLVRDTV